MSKLHKKYLELKQEDSSKLYLFKSGIFYIFLDDDALKMSPIFNLKLTNLNENVLKCGFPVNNLNQYLQKIRHLGLSVKIVDSNVENSYSQKDYLLNSDIKNLIYKLSHIDSNMLSIKEAYNFIDEISKYCKKIEKEMN